MRQLTTRLADQLIASGEPVTLYNTHFRETFTITIVSRDRFTITASDGGKYERSYLTIVEPTKLPSGE